MPGWRGDAPGRRVGVAVLASVVAVVALAISALGLLLPDVAPVDDPGPDVPDRCDGIGSDQRPLPVRSSSLLACPNDLDGMAVVIQGEAIGEVLDGPGGRGWVQVNDDPYARIGPLAAHGATLGTNSGIAVLLPLGFDVGVLGGPGVHGDLVEVVGVFEAASDADQGGPAVIADDATVVRRGRPVDLIRFTGLRRATAAAVVVTVGVGLALRQRRQRLRA